MTFLDSMRCLLELLFFPQGCVVCGDWVVRPDWSPLCEECRGHFREVPNSFCDFCGVPVPGNLLKTRYPCKRCREEPPYFDRARAWGLYDSGLREVLHAFKFEGLRRLAYPLGELLWEVYSTRFRGTDWDALVPIPLHPSRLRRRGFDQALSLSVRLAKRSGIPLRSVLERVRETAPQSGLDLKERRKNLRKAFAVKKGSLTEIPDRSYLLLDDVMTTGTTVNEASKVLKEAGAARVFVLTVARVGHPFDF